MSPAPAVVTHRLVRTDRSPARTRPAPVTPERADRREGRSAEVHTWDWTISQQEANAAEQVVDLLLEDEYEQEVELETSLASELVQMASFKADETDDAAAQSFTLSPVPQPLIDAFRAFKIPQQLQDDYGYPPLTPEIKAKILGVNACGVYGLDPAAVPTAGDRNWLNEATRELGQRIIGT